jgi:hypothetical protein
MKSFKENKKYSNIKITIKFDFHNIIFIIKKKSSNYKYPMESIPTVISLAKEFDYLYKKTYDRVKIIEILIS